MNTGCTNHARRFMKTVAGLLTLFFLMGCDQKDPDEKEGDFNRIAQIEQSK